MDKYQALGLDTTKRSSDPEQVADKYTCIWCNVDVNRGFSMCFSDFVICSDCARRRDHVIVQNTDCFKCHKKDIPGYRNHQSYAVDLSICHECIEWADAYLNSDSLNRLNDQIKTFTKLGGGYRQLIRICKMLQESAVDLSAEEIRRVFESASNKHQLIKRTNSMVDQGLTLFLVTDILNYNNMGKNTKSKEGTIVADAPVMEYIELALVRTSPLNPRKTIDEHAILELAESIKKLGVIQAITVRPDADGYELICGERRYHASVIAGLDVIPASIRNLSDAEAMELMVTENLQRKDVHPLEEADAFKFMIDNMGYSVTDVAAKIAKSDQFVVRRLQLTHLIDTLKDLFKKDELSIGHSELLSRITSKDQEIWHENKFLSSYAGGQGLIKDLKNWIGSSVTKKLSNAPFDITKSFVGEFVCATCTECPLNSANNQILFPDHPEEAICNNGHCFIAKAHRDFENKLAVAIETDTLLVHNTHGADDPVYKQLKGEGHVVLKRYEDFDQLFNPSTATLSRHGWEGAKEYKTRLDNVTKEYEKKKDAAVKAFVISGDYQGTYIEVVLRKNDRTKKVDNANDPEAIRKVEIGKINERRARGLELDREKVMKRLVDHVKDLPLLKSFDTAFYKTDLVAMIVLAYENLGYGDIKKEINEKLGLPREFDAYNGKGGPELFQAIASAPDTLRALIVRCAIFNKFNAVSSGGVNYGVMMNVAKEWCPKDLQLFELDQEGIREKREANMDKKINDLKATK